MTLLDYALAARAAGLSIVPPLEDGSKAPAGAWKKYQSSPPTVAEVRHWYANGRTGIGVVCGEVSGHLEMLELEGRAKDLLPELKSALAAAGLDGLMKRIQNGYCEVTPSGGWHFLYRCTEPIDGNLKLAFNEAHEVLIETRGEGGYVVIAPSSGQVHPTGKAWVRILGSPDSIVTITTAERAALLDVCRSFDRSPRRPDASDLPADEFLVGAGVGERWMDQVIADYNRDTPWETVLAGVFKKVKDVGTATHWYFEGAEHKVSATTNALGTDTLIVFSSTANGHGWKVHEGGKAKAPSYDKFSAHVLITTGRDDRAARLEVARQLRPSDRIPATPPTGVDPETGEVINDRRALPDEVWMSRPYLDHIRRAAWSRGRSPEAVLVNVLARVVADTPHTVELPATVGAPCGLSLLVAVTGPPGSGKSTTKAIAMELVRPSNIAPGCDDVPPGSGEGLLELLFENVTEPDPKNPDKRMNVHRQVRHNVFAFIDEGETLARLAMRTSSSTIMPILRTIFTSGTLGQANASKETHRVIPAGQYVYGIALGIQPAKASALFEDAGGGTPQRLLWASTTTQVPPPHERPEWPGPLDWTPPSSLTLAPLQTRTPHVRHRLTLDQPIVEELMTNDHQRQQHGCDPLDEHHDLIRLKVAAALAILDRRLHVTTDDWQLAGIIGDTSRRVRALVLADLHYIDQGKEEASRGRRVRDAVAADEAVERRRVVDCARKIAKKVSEKPGDYSPSSLRRALNHDRDWFYAALDHAKNEKWVTERTEPGQGQERLTLHPGQVKL